MINATNVSLSYPDYGIALNHVSCTIPQQRITTFIGKSGAGKTSFLKCIASLIRNYEGTITCQNKDIRTLSSKERASLIGFVFQQFNLFPHLSVLENCMQPLKAVLGTSTEHAREKAFQKLQLVGMSELSHKHPATLSGGQQQRAAIARALCLEPQILLLDEPTSALDPESTHTLKNILLELVRNRITIAVSSHDMSFIKQILDNIYFFDLGSIKEHYDVRTGTALQMYPYIANFLHHGQ